MPYIKKKRPQESLNKLIHGENWTYEEMGRIMGCSRQTASKKAADPTLLTVGDLVALHRSGHIPHGKILEAIEF